jgi:hypothetical protein
MKERARYWLIFTVDVSLLPEEGTSLWRGYHTAITSLHFSVAFKNCDVHVITGNIHKTWQHRYSQQRNSAVASPLRKVIPVLNELSTKP